MSDVIPLSHLRRYLRGLIAYWQAEGDTLSAQQLLPDAILNLRWYLEVCQTRGRAFDPDLWEGAC